MKHIVIIGGMGPQASLELHGRILDAAAKRGITEPHHFPRITHLSLPIEDFIDDEAKVPAALAQITAAMSRVAIDRDTHVVMACNTAHIMQTDIERAIGAPLTSLVALVKTQLIKDHITRVGLLASSVTRRRKLYGKTLHIDDHEQRALEHSIRNVIAGAHTDNDRKLVESLITKLQAQGAQVVILGCTELSVLRPHGAGVIDPLELMAEHLTLEQPNKIQDTK